MGVAYGVVGREGMDGAGDDVRPRDLLLTRVGREGVRRVAGAWAAGVWDEDEEAEFVDEVELRKPSVSLRLMLGFCE